MKSRGWYTDTVVLEMIKDIAGPILVNSASQTALLEAFWVGYNAAAADNLAHINELNAAMDALRTQLNSLMIESRWLPEEEEL